MIVSFLRHASSIISICLDISYLGDEGPERLDRVARIYCIHLIILHSSRRKASVDFSYSGIEYRFIGRTSAEAFAYTSTTDMSELWADLFVLSGTYIPRTSWEARGHADRAGVFINFGAAVIWKGKCRLAWKSDSASFSVAHLYGVSLPPDLPANGRFAVLLVDIRLG